MFEYYYNNSPEQLHRRNRADVISIHTDMITRPPKSFKEECQIAAENILDKDTNIWLGLTGGWLSKVALDSFISVGFKPNVFIIELNSGQNEFDTSWAKKICASRKIEPLIIEATVFPNAPEILIDFGAATQIYSYYDLIVASKIRTIPGRALLLDNLEVRRDINPNGKWSFILDEGKYYWTKRYSSMFPNKRIIDRFFTSSPEILLSFLQLPEVEKITDGSVNGKISLNSSRNTIFNAAGFSKESPYLITPGSQKVPDAEERNSEIMEQKMGFYNRKFYFELDELKYSLMNKERMWDFV